MFSLAYAKSLAPRELKYACETFPDNSSVIVSQRIKYLENVDRWMMRSPMKWSKQILVLLVSAEKKWCESFRWLFVEMSNVYCLGYNMWAIPLLSVFILNGLCLFSRFELEYSLYVARTHYVLDSLKWDTMFVNWSLRGCILKVDFVDLSDTSNRFTWTSIHAFHR